MIGASPLLLACSEARVTARIRVIKPSVGSVIVVDAMCNVTGRVESKFYGDESRSVRLGFSKKSGEHRSAQ